MSSNRYYDEWDTPREAILIRDVPVLIVKPGYGSSAPDFTLWAEAGDYVIVEGRMTEDTREMYGGRWLYNMRCEGGGALVEHGVDFEFIEKTSG